MTRAAKQTAPMHTPTVSTHSVKTANAQTNGHLGVPNNNANTDLQQILGLRNGRTSVMHNATLSLLISCAFLPFLLLFFFCFTFSCSLPSSSLLCFRKECRVLPSLLFASLSEHLSMGWAQYAQRHARTALKTFILSIHIAWSVLSMRTLAKRLGCLHRLAHAAGYGHI